MTTKTPHCPYCGSRDIRHDGTARWDGQAWTLVGLAGRVNCEDCGDDFASHRIVWSLAESPATDAPALGLEPMDDRPHAGAAHDPQGSRCTLDARDVMPHSWRDRR